MPDARAGIAAAATRGLPRASVCRDPRSPGDADSPMTTVVDRIARRALSGARGDSRRVQETTRDGLRSSSCALSSTEASAPSPPHIRIVRGEILLAGPARRAPVLPMDPGPQSPGRAAARRDARALSTDSSRAAVVPQPLRRRGAAGLSTAVCARARVRASGTRAAAAQREGTRATARSSADHRSGAQSSSECSTASSWPATTRAPRGPR